ncbi:hypothetical protein JW921_05605, partial [Candidatus Fermentibacterales bacterium]|nr:hypothetical protein [Candidatus Fermentibacterales bacterium]
MTGQDRKRRIAILEDERDILELVALHMERAGFETMKHRTAGDLMSALQRLRPDLLILDLML